MYKYGKEYSASTISNGKYRGIYDGLIVLVDGVLDYLTEWVYEEQSNGLTYEEAIEEVIASLPLAYESNKQFIVFEGIPPVKNGGFDVFTTYKCIKRIGE